MNEDSRGQQRIPLVEPPALADMYMDSSLTLWLPHVQLAQLRIRLGLPVKEVVLERDAMTKPSSPERTGQPVRRVQVGNRDLYIYDVRRQALERR